MIDRHAKGFPALRDKLAPPQIRARQHHLLVREKTARLLAQNKVKIRQRLVVVQRVLRLSALLHVRLEDPEFSTYSAGA
jgi:hypothetical protein